MTGSIPAPNPGSFNNWKNIGSQMGRTKKKILSEQIKA